MSKIKKVYVSVSNDLTSDQRVHKICTFIENQGYDVCLLGRELKNSIELKRTYQTKRLKLLFNKGPMFYASLNIRLFFYLLTKKIDILVANDLDTLLSNYLISKIKKVKLVYDSHEYYTETPELQNREIVRKIWHFIEKSIFPSLNYIYTVNDSIKNEYERKYNKKIEVIRNVSPNWYPKDLKSKEELNIPKNKFIMILQGAGINIDRGAEELVESMLNLPEMYLLIIGSGDCFPKIKNIVKTKNITNVKIIDKKPYSEMMNYTFYADIGLSLDKKTNLNYLYSLPNKVFDYIQAEIPIISSDVVEVKKIIERHNIGECISKVNVDEIRKKLKSIYNQPDKLLLWKENCKKAKNIENWENEMSKLEKFYPKL